MPVAALAGRVNSCEYPARSAVKQIVCQVEPVRRPRHDVPVVADAGLEDIRCAQRTLGQGFFSQFDVGIKAPLMRDDEFAPLVLANVKHPPNVKHTERQRFFADNRPDSGFGGPNDEFGVKSRPGADTDDLRGQRLVEVFARAEQVFSR